MRGRARALFALTALALVLCVGLNVYLSAEQSKLAYTGEVLYGSREEAEGVSIAMHAVNSRHQHLNTTYYPVSGENDSEGHWSLATYKWEYGGIEPALSITTAGINIGFSWSGGEVERIFEDLEGWQREMAEYARARIDGESGRWSGKLLLNDYVDSLPVHLFARCVKGDSTDPENPWANVDVDELFCVPIPGEVWMDVSLSLSTSDGYSEGELDISPSNGRFVNSDSYSVWASDEYMYFAALFYTEDENGENFELLDGSHLPGGGWGIWRVRCASENGWFYGPTNTETLTADFDTLESVYTFPEDWENVQLTMDESGERLLLLSFQDGELYLTVIDVASGDVAQQTKLLDASETARLDIDRHSYADFYTQDSFTAMLIGNGMVAVANTGAGEYELVCAYDLTELPAPEWLEAKGNYYWADDYLFAWDGERIAVYEQGVVDNISSQRAWNEAYHRLSIFRDGELVYSEWLTTQLDWAYLNNVTREYELKIE